MKSAQDLMAVLIVMCLLFLVAGYSIGVILERSDIIDHCQKLTAFSRGDKVFTCFLEKEVK